MVQRSRHHHLNASGLQTDSFRGSVPSAEFNGVEDETKNLHLYLDRFSAFQQMIDLFAKKIRSRILVFNCINYPAHSKSTQTHKTSEIQMCRRSQFSIQWAKYCDLRSSSLAINPFQLVFHTLKTQINGILIDRYST